MKRLLATILLLHSFLFVLSALDLRGAIHVDTYAGTPSVGFSFLAQEHIASILSMRAQADYLSANSYEVQTMVVGSLSRFIFGGGFAMGIKAGTEHPIAPGVGALFGMRITSRLDTEASAQLTFSPINLNRVHDLRAKLKFIYKTDNAVATMGYNLLKGFSTTDFVNSLYMNVDAFEADFPIGLTLGSSIDFFFTPSDRGLDIHMLGGVTFITKKYGTYFSKVKIGVLNHQPDKSLPFDIAVGARFSL